ncbi:family 43 glycosylhydrolase [Paenibacillus sacheonensis]|uniref:Family 43 glycosylhydrolase n=1 Tax=Paenibacillus sacheonensis TaxID=742054 RepID=A0A7X4YUT8_9BACL|nr:family 43 glycosylhydrolase [Paenibacillus sacheonensis]MBM7568030.1 GH43 family beta-xylosidase [Paenibacillus sacheonensis]NBC72940.1 family 43 glycosylhydrolase [Paenibacillus sacheonensis]
MSRMKWAGSLLLLLCLGTAGCADNDDAGEKKVPGPALERTYANPIKLADEWGDYGLGDPFVFAFDGAYYLYVSTRDTDAGVKVWRSEDLVDWTYEGLAADDPVTTGAYAPEVRYWNGKFYMYTSPAGQGHYVLVGDKPTGPFTVATDNFGRTIDGTTFVDDDGQWYFYYAGPSGIQSAPMTDPLTVAPEEAQTGAYMGGWTEGPTVFKHNGKYYMTYTGNHVFSAGYRVDAAVSDSPLQGFAGQANNPVLLRTEGATVGLGHNSVVTGPDLDTQYMVYHNLEGHGVVGPLRHMNIDRIVWDGNRLQVAGPTSEAQPAPALPAFADRFDRTKLGKAWKSKGDADWSITAEQGLTAKGTDRPALSTLVAREKTPASYTAEFHVRHLTEGKGKSGVVFSYVDGANYGIAEWNAADHTLEARYVKNGQAAAEQSAKVPGNLDLGQLQTVRIEKAGGELRVYAEGMKLLTMALPAEAGAGQIGYAVEGADADFGYVAFSGSIDGSGTGLAYAPLPGRVNAFQDEAGAASRSMLADDGAGGFAAAKLHALGPLTYRVNAAKTDTYRFDFRVSASGGARLRLTEGGKPVTDDVEIKPSGGSGASWQTVSVRGAKLSAGPHRLTLEVEQGELSAAWFAASPDVPVAAKQDGFDAKMLRGWTPYDGQWSVKEGQLRASSSEDGKILTGEDGWSDYAVEADVTVPDEGGQTGLLVRVTEPANGAELNQNRSDFQRGYFAYVDVQGVHLAKHDYDTTSLADAAMAMPKAGEMVRLKVAAAGSVISVYVGDAAKPAIRYADDADDAFLHGRVGFKSVSASSRFDAFGVAPLPEAG